MLNEFGICVISSAELASAAEAAPKYCLQIAGAVASSATGERDVLNQIGWRVTVLEGGYKTYRAYVRQQLKTLPPQCTFQVLSGLTGSGKTYILHQLAQHGVQVLELEGLANHSGSLLGQQWQGQPTPQPSQNILNPYSCWSYNALTPASRFGLKPKAIKLDSVIYPRPFGNK